jgi:hypothetical protein
LISPWKDKGNNRKVKKERKKRKKGKKKVCRKKRFGGVLISGHA